MYFLSHFNSEMCQNKLYYQRLSSIHLTFLPLPLRSYWTFFCLSIWCWLFALKLISLSNTIGYVRVIYWFCLLWSYFVFSILKNQPFVNIHLKTNSDESIINVFFLLPLYSLISSLIQLWDCYLLSSVCMLE